MPEICIIAHDIRSCHNVGSLLRTAEGLGVSHVYFAGYTPYPLTKNDTRLPHEARKLAKQIEKTALGAERLVSWTHEDNILSLIDSLKVSGYTVAALEQAANAISLPSYKSPEKIAIILGREVEGIESQILAACDVILEIPMFGQKESFNVVQAAAMILYHVRFSDISSMLH